MSLQETALLSILENTELSDGVLVSQMEVKGAGHDTSHTFLPHPLSSRHTLTPHSNPDGKFHPQ